MNNTVKLLATSLSALYLTSCGMYSDSEQIVYNSFPTETYQMYSQESYPVNYYTNYNYNYKENYRQNQGVVVPDSYHVGQHHSPQSFKDRDRLWVNSQNPGSYTIELADDEQAAAVAQKLYKAPKDDRRAQIKYQRNGKSYYKGLYGTYDNAEAAQKALNALPENVRTKAGVKNWGSVQSNLNQE